MGVDDGQGDEADWMVGWKTQKMPHGVENNDDAFPTPERGVMTPPGDYGPPPTSDQVRVLMSKHRPRREKHPDATIDEDIEEVEDAMCQLNEFEQRLARKSFDFARTMLDTRDVPAMTPLPHNPRHRPNMYARPVATPIILRSSPTPNDDTRERNMERAVFTIAHLGDVSSCYEYPKEPVGGVARFAGFLKSINPSQFGKSRGNTQDERGKPFLFFTGNAYSGGDGESNIISRGHDAVEYMNAMGVDAAVPGVHDFAYGVDHFSMLASKCQFPWLLSNVLDRATKQPLKNTHRSVIFEVSDRLKIGVMGLVDSDWLLSVDKLPKSVACIDCVQEAQTQVAELRNQGCNAIVALTNVKGTIEKRLCEVQGITIILGRFDKKYGIEVLKNTTLVKGGQGFRQFTLARVVLNAMQSIPPRVTTHRCDVGRTQIEHDEVKTLVSKWQGRFKTKQYNMIGNVGESLDIRNETLGRRCTNFGNLVADVARKSTRSEVALISASSFKMNGVLPRGRLSTHELLQMFRMDDTLVVIHIDGERLKAALNHGVESFPNSSKSFLQVSGISYSFDSTHPKGHKIQNIMVGDEPLADDVMYRVATMASMACDGENGFRILYCPTFLRPRTECPNLATMMRAYFRGLKNVSRVEDKDGVKLKRVEYLRIKGVTDKRILQTGGPKPLPTTRIIDQSPVKARKATDPIEDSRAKLQANVEIVEQYISGKVTEDYLFHKDSRPNSEADVA